MLLTKYTDVNQNASLIITDFLVVIYKNEQPHTTSYVEVEQCVKMT